MEGHGIVAARDIVSDIVVVCEPKDHVVVLLHQFRFVIPRAVVPAIRKPGRNEFRFVFGFPVRPSCIRGDKQ